MSVSDGDKFIYLLPANEFKVTARIDFNHKSIGLQHFEYVDDPAVFATEISRAKTFGFLEQVQQLQKSGFILGGSYDNAIVLDSEGVVNEEIQSYKDEFVRHKLLDIVGDMSLVGHNYLMAHIVAYKSGHAMHSAVLNELLKRKSCFKVVSKPSTVDEGLFSKEALTRLGLSPNFG